MACKPSRARPLWGLETRRQALPRAASRPATQSRQSEAAACVTPGRVVFGLRSLARRLASISSAPLTAFGYLGFVGCVVSFLPPMAVARLRHRGDEGQRIPGRWMRRLGRTITHFAPQWSLAVEGTLPADIGRRGYVVVANHESVTDPLLLSWVPCDMRWIAKEELFRMPLVGWAMRLSGDIPLRRGDGESIREMMDACERCLAAGVPVMIFPEGTCSKSAELLPFKLGAFTLAIRAGVPILPLAVAGSRAMRAKGGMRLLAADACVCVLEPISTEGLGEDDAPLLAERVRAHITAALPELRARYKAPRRPGEPAPAQVDTTVGLDGELAPVAMPVTPRRVARG